MSEKNNNKLLEISIISPEEILFQGQASSLTCYNTEGEFDILPYHSNFISLIYKSITVKDIHGHGQKFEIGYALLKCLSDSITILTNVDISSYTEILTSKRTPEVS
ncbi:hypothetical protein BH09PAT2_BH09PAT2_02120 [soil metagenome]